MADTELTRADLRRAGVPGELAMVPLEHAMVLWTATEGKVLVVEHPAPHEAERKAREGRAMT